MDDELRLVIGQFYESNNTENIGFDKKIKKQKNKTTANKKNNLETNTKEKNKKNKKTAEHAGLFFLLFSCFFCFFWWFFLSICFFGDSVFYYYYFLLKSTFSVLHGVIMQESGKNWIEISEQERRCFGLRIFFGIGSV